MTITVTTADLKAATNACARVAEPGHQHLSAVHLDMGGWLRLTAADFDLSAIQIDIDHNDGPEIADVIVTPAALLRDVAARCPGETTMLTPDEGHLLVTSGRWKAKIPAGPADDWDAYLPKPLAGLPATVDSDTLFDAVGRVAVAASKDTGRPQLAGVRLQPSDTGLIMVATDSYRLAVRHVDTDAVDSPATVPAAVLRQVANHRTDSPVDLWLTERAARFRTGMTTITTSLIEGDYPQWERLVPDTGNGVATIDNPEALAAALKRVARTFGGDQSLVRITFGRDGASLQSVQADTGESTEDVDLIWDGPALTVGFNASFLADGLGSFDGPVTFTLIDDLKPAVLRPVDATSDHDLYLQMPVRLI